MKVKTKQGWTETDKVAEFTRIICGEETAFCVTRSLDHNNLVVTHVETGWKVSDIDLLEIARFGELRAAKNSLETFINATSERRFYDLILRLRDR